MRVWKRCSGLASMTKIRKSESRSSGSGRSWRVSAGRSMLEVWR